MTSEIVEHVGPDGEVSRLPAGEHVLWAGAPDQRSLARYFLRERWLLAFVGVSFSLGAAEALQHADGAIPRLIGVATLSAVMALVAIVSIRVLAWQMAKTSKYVITDRRIFFNIGIVLRADANIPFSSIERVDVQRRADGSADLMVTLTDAQEIPWLLLFPHMTWRGSRRGRPTFRALRNPQAAADAVVGALQRVVPAVAANDTRLTTPGVSAGARSVATAAVPSPA